MNISVLLNLEKQKKRNWGLTIGERIENTKSKGIKKHKIRIFEFQMLYRFMILKIYFHMQFTKKANKDIIAFHMINASIFSSCSFFIYFGNEFYFY